MTTTKGDDGGSPLGTYLNILRWPGLDPKSVTSIGAAKVSAPVTSNEDRAKKASVTLRCAVANRTFMAASVLQDSLDPPSAGSSELPRSMHAHWAALGRRRPTLRPKACSSIKFDRLDAIRIVLHVGEEGLHRLRQAERLAGPVPVLAGSGVVQDAEAANGV